MTTVRRLSVSVVLGVALLTSSCRQGPQTFTLGVQRAEMVVLYEGLPHQTFARQLLAEERRTKAIQEFHGYPFYEEPLTLAEADATRLSEILGDPGVFHPFSGEKACGGFHPDYLVEWHVGADRFRALICFGCHEIMLFGPELESRNNLGSDAEHRLTRLLERYRKNRP